MSLNIHLLNWVALYKKITDVAGGSKSKLELVLTPLPELWHCDWYVPMASLLFWEGPQWTLLLGAIDKHNVMLDTDICFSSWGHSRALKLCFSEQPKVKQVTHFWLRLLLRRHPCSNELKLDVCGYGGRGRNSNLMEFASNVLLRERKRLSLLLFLSN